MSEKLNIYKIKIKKIKVCSCGLELTPETTSKWCIVISNKKAVQQCVLCNEVNNRLLSSARKIGNELIPQKTRAECLDEIIEEGLTTKILKNRE